MALVVPAVIPKLLRLAAGPAYLPTNSGNGLDSASANNPNVKLSFVSVDDGATVELMDMARDLGGIGGFSRPAAAVRPNLVRVKPQFEFKPTTKEWLNLLPWVMGQAGSGTAPAAVTFAPATNRGVRRRMALDLGTMVRELRGCQVERATFAAQAGGELTASIQATAVDYATINDYPTGLATLDGVRFLMRDNALTVAWAGLDPSPAALPCRNFSATIAYTSPGDRQFNSATDDPVWADREVSCELEVPWGSAQALWARGGTPVGLTAAFVAVVDTTGPKTVSITFNFGAIVFPPPTVPIRVADREAFTRIAATAYMSDGTTEGSEISVVVESNEAN